MQVAQSIPHAPPHEMHPSLVSRVLDLLHLHHPTVREIIAYDDEGNEIGRIVAPNADDVFGAGRGAVYLRRE